MTGEPRAELLRMLGGFMVTQAIGVAARLGVADGVAGGPRRIGELADDAGVDADALARILRALESLGVFAVEDGAVRNTPRSELLRSDSPMSLRWLATCFSDEHYEAWCDAGEAVRRGDTVFAERFGSPYFDWLGGHPEQADTFNRAMAGGSILRRQAALGRDWSRERTVVDVGGGTGTLLTEVLSANPHLEGIVFDLPHAREGAERTIAAAGLEGRCRFEPGSFFERVPAGADAYVLSNILHDWDDGRAAAILRACREAAPEQARLVLVEAVLRPGPWSDWFKLLDLHMLILLGGRERTEDEWRALLRAGGFELETVAEGTGATLLEAARLPAATIEPKANPGAS